MCFRAIRQWFRFLSNNEKAVYLSEHNTELALGKNMEELKKLEHLSLVSKICVELDNHLGLGDKTLAEFIIHLAEENER